jgi:hypothetical protein
MEQIIDTTIFVPALPVSCRVCWAVDTQLNTETTGTLMYDMCWTGDRGQ